MKASTHAVEQNTEHTSKENGFKAPNAAKLAGRPWTAPAFDHVVCGSTSWHPGTRAALALTEQDAQIE